MVMWLPLDETNGDTSANLASPADPGTQIGQPTPWLGAYVDNSLAFNGSNYVVVPDYPGIEIGTNDLSIDAWVYLMETNNYATNVIVDKGNFTGYGLWLSPNSGLEFVTAGGIYSQGTPIPSHQWHFVAVSFSRSTGQGFFYVDGAPAGRSFTPTTANLSNTNSLWIAASPNLPLGSGSGYAWVGALDEVEVFNRALSTNELNAIYGAGTAGKCKPCCYLNKLTIGKITPDSVEVNWGGCGVLEETSSLNLPVNWSPILNAASPYIIQATGATTFYRLECQ
jgi:hypothetical protein